MGEKVRPVEITDDGEENILKRTFGVTAYDALKLRLYSDDRTPSKSDEVSYYTEVTGGGYTAITISTADWTFSNATGNTVATLDTQTFSFTSAIPLISGYYITDNSGSVLFMAERFSDGPYENYTEATLEIDLAITIGS